MSISVNTNQAALIALQNLNKTSSDLAVTQSRISTGLKIATAKDSGAIWAISQTEKSQVSALDAVTESLNNSKSVLDVTLSSGNTLTDLLNKMSKDALGAQDDSVTDATRKQYQDDFNALAKSISNTVQAATFNGKNLIDGKDATGLSAIGDVTGDLKLTSASQNLTAPSLLNGSGGTVVATSGATAALWTGSGGPAAAKTAAAAIQNALAKVTSAMAQYGTDSSSMDSQLTLVSNLQDSLNVGVGNLVDADVAAESANLTALQTKQQLGVQALSIANSAPQIILSLFKG